MLLLRLVVLFVSLNITFGVAIESVILFSKTLFSVLDEAVDVYESATGSTIFGKPTKEKKLYDSLANITHLIERIEHDIPQVTITKIKELERDFSKILHFEIKLDELVNHVGNIESKYEKFLKLRNKVMNLDNQSVNKSIAARHTLEKTANAILFESGNVADSLDKMNQLVNGENVVYGKQDVFSLILENFNNQKSQSRCLMTKSPQQLIHDLHTSIRMVQLKGIIMTEFSYMILSVYNGGDYKEYIDDFHDVMVKRLNKQAKIANEVMNKADNSLWKCDPDEFVFNQTYIEITRLLQGYISNERELSHNRKCFDGCGYYSYVNGPACSNEDPLCQKQPKCTGRVFDCRLVDEDMRICFADTTNSRRYEWIRHDKGVNYGNVDKKCLNSDRVNMFRQYLAWRCFYCFCICDEESLKSDRFFSLLPAVSDVKNNKAVVGVRFMKKDRVIHLQVKEGQLQPGGLIDNETVAWVSAPPIDVYNWLDKHKYHTLRYESRSFDLDDLVGPKNYLLTGVRLRTLGDHLNLEVQLTAFNFTTGKLNPELSFWKGNDNTDAAEENPRQKHYLLSRKPATLNKDDFCEPSSKPDTYLEFTFSDEYADAAQSTVPFIDTQEAASEPAMPLIGVGIMHKQSRGSAGFIEPKVFTYNVGEQLLMNEIRSRK